MGKATWWAQGGEVLRVEHYEDGQVVRTVKRVGGEMIVQER